MGFSLRTEQMTRFSLALLVSLLTAIISISCATTQAVAASSEEKRLEAAEVAKHVDALQTGLNAARDMQATASSEYSEAIRLRDEAAARIEETSARVDALQAKLASFAVSMYKSDGANTFLGVLLQTTSFSEFMTTWDRCTIISDIGTDLLAEEKEARQQLEEAKAAYEEQSERAEQKMKAAEASATQIANTQAALREEIDKLNAEADRLAAEEAEKAKEKTEEGGEQPKDEITEEEEAEIKERAAAIAAAAASANAEASASSVMGTGFFVNPCPTATESSGFGYREFDHSFHKGLDMAAPEGTPYYAADSGTVLYATNDGSYNGGAGNWIVISHGNGIVTKYMHSLTTFVRPGDHVERGQNIGLVGNTGNSSGPHLHFQVEFDNVAVNPLNYI